MEVEKTPLVSIITPAFNASRFIADTISSAINQTYENWEMLIVDDCSTDNTCSIVESFTARDDRIRLIKQEVNGGPSKARNKALENANGRFVAFLDGDDMWLPEKLTKQLSFMKAHKAAVSFTQYCRISDTGNKVGELVSIPQKLTYSQLLKNTAIATSTAVVDKNKTGPFYMVDTYYDDFVLWLSLLKKGFVAYGFREDMVRYRIVGKSVSRNKAKSARMVWRTYRDIEHLNIVHAVWCFANYAFNAFIKYRKF